MTTRIEELNVSVATVNRFRMTADEAVGSIWRPYVSIPRNRASAGRLVFGCYPIGVFMCYTPDHDAALLRHSASTAMRLGSPGASKGGKPAQCQPTTVSGFTMTRGSFLEPHSSQPHPLKPIEAVHFWSGMSTANCWRSLNPEYASAYRV